MERVSLTETQCWVGGLGGAHAEKKTPMSAVWEDRRWWERRQAQAAPGLAGSVRAWGFCQGR